MGGGPRQDNHFTCRSQDPGSSPLMLPRAPLNPSTCYFCPRLAEHPFFRMPDPRWQTDTLRALSVPLRHPPSLHSCLCRASQRQPCQNPETPIFAGKKKINLAVDKQWEKHHTLLSCRWDCTPCSEAARPSTLLLRSKRWQEHLSAVTSPVFSPGTKHVYTNASPRNGFIPFLSRRTQC